MTTILQITNSDRNLSQFSRGLKSSGLEDKLKESGPFTLLGPVNLAFGKFEAITSEQMFSVTHHAHLLELLSCHILQGKHLVKDLVPGRKYKTIHNKEVTVKMLNGDIYINEARILSRDRQAWNGVLHSLNCFYAVPA